MAPDRAVQDDTIAKIEEIEEKIRVSKIALNDLTGKTASILNQYLK